METVTASSWMSAGGPTLNRTIVGWKRTRHVAWCMSARTLNRTIVGWKLIIRRFGPPAGPGFKSHHSGMETTLRLSTICESSASLNRTIVGWKLGFSAKEVIPMML